MMNRRQSLLMLPALALAKPAAALDLGKALGVLQNTGSAMSLSDTDMRAHAGRMAQELDGQAKIAPDNHPMTKRLTALSMPCRNDNGLALNFKVYLTPEVNAFALADGSIRFYAGLMDMMTDDEVRYVIGHEVGHVQAGHSKKRMQVALGSGAAREAAVAVGGSAGAIASSNVGDLIVKVVKAQHSQSNENEADDYAMGFMKRYRFERSATVTALEKLDKLSGGGGASWLSTHPAPRDRAERMRQQLA